jgi:hypothetical protein
MANFKWELELYDRLNVTKITDIGEYQGLSFNDQINDIGFGSVTVNRECKNSDGSQPFKGGGEEGITTLYDATEYVVRVYRRNLDDDTRKHIFSFFAEDSDDSPIKPDEKHDIVLQGPGLGRVLEWITVYPPGFPNHVFVDHEYPPLGREAEQWPFGKIYKNLIEEAQGYRTRFTYIECFWTDLYDSESVAWTDNNEISDSPGNDMLSRIREWSDEGRAFEWHMESTPSSSPMPNTNKMRLTLFNPGGMGQNRAATVRYERGKNILEKKITMKRGAVRGIVLVQGGDNFFTEVTDATSIANYGEREDYLMVEDARSDPTRVLYGNARLNYVKGPIVSYWLKVPHELEDGTACPLPFTDFFLGDTIEIDDTGRVGWTEQRFIAYSIGVDDQNDEGSVELTFQTNIKPAEIQSAQFLLRHKKRAIRDQHLPEIIFFKSVLTNGLTSGPYSPPTVLYATHLSVTLGTAGTSASTFQVLKNGVALTPNLVMNAGIVQGDVDLNPRVRFSPTDVLQVRVVTAGTGASDATFQVSLR